MRLPMITTALFVLAVGACVGSLINVLVYRLPRGLDVVTPTSRCPSCGTKLTWRENIPILGWLLLRGRCRFCKSKISAEYPIVESIVAFLFVAIFVLWYMVPSHATLLGVPVGAIAPEWAANGPGRTWPAFVVLAMLVASLVAMTIIDARTCTIPLVLTWVPAVTALVFHTGHAAWFDLQFAPLTQSLPGIWRSGSERMTWLTATGEVWTMATGGQSGWKFIGMGLGGMAGLGVSLAMMSAGLLRRSFGDYEAWEKDALRAAEAEAALKTPVPVANDPAAAGEQPSDDHPAHMWIQYPHARREMVLELAFLAPPVLGALAGGWAAVRIVSAAVGPWIVGDHGQLMAPTPAPLWLTVLGAVCMGYLIGGGLVWAVRIFGTLLFGKEAMGLGDVHLMAAVGACLGWIDPTIAFFLAAFVGVGWAILARIVGGKFNRAMPYGPFLAIATLLVVLDKPMIEIGLGRLLSLGGPFDLP